MAEVKSLNCRMNWIREGGQQKMGWLDGITNFDGLSLSKLRDWWWTGSLVCLQSMGCKSQTQTELLNNLNWESKHSVRHLGRKIPRCLSLSSSIYKWDNGSNILIKLLRVKGDNTAIVTVDLKLTLKANHLIILLDFNTLEFLVGFCSIQLGIYTLIFPSFLIFLLICNF